MGDNIFYILISNEKYDRTIRKLARKVNRCGGSIFVLSVITGLLLGTALIQQNRLDELEARMERQKKAD